MSVARPIAGFCLVVAVALATACARHVVVDPSFVPSRSQPDWTVQSAPSSAPPAPARAGSAN